MTSLDEAEYERLQSAIKDAERLFGGNPENSISSVAAKLQPMKDRMTTLVDDGVFDPDRRDRKKSDSATSVAIAALVAQEYRLNQAERQTYADFLRQDYFTRNDFEKLDAFYADEGAWDRLSENGKKNMSERFWKGIEQGEYTLQETPKNVRDKESEQLAFYIQNPDKAPEVVQRMSPATKADFIRAHEAGEKEAAKEILNSKGLFESSPQEKTQAATEHSVVAADRDNGTIMDQDESGIVDSKKAELDEADELGLEDLGDFGISMTSLPKPVDSDKTAVLGS